MARWMNATVQSRTALSTTRLLSLHLMSAIILDAVLKPEVGVEAKFSRHDELASTYDRLTVHP
jgi:hypothetical protein